MSESNEPIFDGLENLRKVIDAFAANENKKQNLAKTNTERDTGALGLPVVHLETEMFDAWAIAFFALPAFKVMDVIAIPENQRMIPFVNLLKLALQNPQQIDNLDILTLREMQKLIEIWLTLSNKLERQTDGDPST